MSKELVEIVRCKNCIHRPIKGEGVHDIDPPKDSRGDNDYACPLAIWDVCQKTAYGEESQIYDSYLKTTRQL